MLAVTNTQGSIITREADAVLLTKAGPEVGVAATKTFLTQTAVMHLLALELARVRSTLAEKDLLGLGHELRLIPERLEEVIETLGDRAVEAAEIFVEARCSLFLGRGVSYPVALEGALKLKEISYLPSEGYPAGEMKHGPIALIDEYCPVVAILGEGVAREKTLSNVEETLARGARIVTIARDGDPAAEKISAATLSIPEVPEILSPLISRRPPPTTRLPRR